MTAATRTTPTQANGGSDDGVAYTNAVQVEIAALWRLAPQWLTNVSGSNTITATSDTAFVAAITAYARGMAFYLTPAANNTGAVTIQIDGITPAQSIKTRSGGALSSGNLVSGSLYLIVYDGTNFRAISTLS